MQAKQNISSRIVAKERDGRDGWKETGTELPDVMDTRSLLSGQRNHSQSYFKTFLSSSFLAMLLQIKYFLSLLARCLAMRMFIVLQPLAIFIKLQCLNFTQSLCFGMVRSCENRRDCEHRFTRDGMLTRRHSKQLTFMSGDSNLCQK